MTRSLDLWAEKTDFGPIIHVIDSFADLLYPVAVFMEQGVNAVISAFGLLKAGKIFLPIDPVDPHKRVTFMLHHAPARIILTNDEYVGLAEELAPPDCQLINVDQIGEGSKEGNPSLPISPLYPAMLLYTSGSTGQPKGVMYTQRSLLHDLMIKTNLMRYSPGDRISLLSWGTGQAIKLIFAALLNGACLHLFNLKREGLAHLAAWMMRERITVHTFSAPICRSFLALLKGDEEFPNLRLIRTASDTVYPEDILRLQEHFGDHCYFVNALASSETGLK